MFELEEDTRMHVKLGVGLILVTIMSKVSLPALAFVAPLQVVDITVPTATEKRGLVNTHQSDEPRNTPSSAPKRFSAPVLPLSFNAGKSDLAGSKRSKGRRDDQGSTTHHTLSSA